MLLTLAGCASHRVSPAARAPDWVSEDFVAEGGAVPRPAPIPASAPTAAPVPADLPPSNASPAPENQFSGTWIPLYRWCKVQGLSAPRLVTAAPVPTYSIATTNGILALRAGSQLAQWDGLELRLGFAPQLIDNQPYVHALELRKTLQPLLLGQPAFCLETNPILVIDPGHGGENSGTKGLVNGHYEKDFTLDWARRIQALLVSSGWQVYLTRTNDTDLALSNRVAFADEHRAGLFLSLHFNSAAPDDSQAGLETYCLTPAGMPSSVTREFPDDPTLSFPNNTFDLENLELALRVHRALLQVNGGHDRGVRRARFLGVLRGQQRPAILIEGGYLSNPHEARLIATASYRQKLAVAVARALLEESDVGRLASRGSPQPSGFGIPEPGGSSQTNRLP